MAFLQQCAFFATGMHNYHTHHNVLHIYHTPIAYTRVHIPNQKPHRTKAEHPCQTKTNQQQSGTKRETPSDSQKRIVKKQ